MIRNGDSEEEIGFVCGFCDLFADFAICFADFFCSILISLNFSRTYSNISGGRFKGLLRSDRVTCYSNTSYEWVGSSTAVVSGPLITAFVCGRVKAASHDSQMLVTATYSQQMTEVISSTSSFDQLN